MTHNTEASLPIFVYGTLRRGMCRESAWPYPPQKVKVGYAAGRLFDLGDYPAMTPGPHWILGELWSFWPEHLAATLATIDAIEGFKGNSGDLYQRVIISCRLERPVWRDYLSATHPEGSEPTISAYSYHYAIQLSGATEIAPNEAGICLWAPPAKR